MSDYKPEDPIKNTPEGAAGSESLPGTSVSRRRMLQAMGVTAGAGALAASGLGRAGHAAAAPGAASQAVSAKRTGTIKDVKHVVVMMQENRPFDTYFGTLSLAGVAGFGDKQAVQFANGQNILFQPDASRPEGFLLPFRQDASKVNAQNVVPNLGYFTAADAPWQHAIAHAYTVGDHYHCSLNTSTDPNRIMLWTGTNDPNGGHGGPRINNNNNGQFLFTWITYPEILQQAGVSWQIYTNNDVGENFLGDFEDNLLRDFAVYNPINANAENTVPHQGLLARANVLQTHTTPPPGVTNDPSDLDYVLKDFIADCASGQLPEISWVISPALWSEHPNGAPNYGAVYVNRVIQALHDNPELWESTLLILNYDENGGNFDHILRPTPEPGTPDEGAPGLTPGTGNRTPFVLISPWTRGGWVASETFDHTSVIQFMELFTTTLGKPAICPNISAWRRSICGDLTSAIDFTSFDTSLPELPAPADLLAVVELDKTLPPVTQPAPGQQTVPVQPVFGPLKLRPVPYQQHATVAVDRSSGAVTATMTNPSNKAVSMQVFESSVLATPFSYRTDTQTVGTPNTVSKAAGPKTYAAKTSNGQYDFSIYGADRFVRRFAGTVVPAGQNAGQVPVVDAKLGTGNTKTLKITLANEGHTDVRFTLIPNDYEGQQKTVKVRFGQHVAVDWPTNQFGYYDVIVTADTADGFTQRFAGRIS